MFNSITKKLKGEQPTPKKNEDIEGFICPICMASFTSPEMVQHHFDEKHPEDTSKSNSEPEALFSPTTQRKESIRDIQENLNDLRQSLDEEVWYNEELKKECTRLNSVVLEKDKDIQNREKIIQDYINQITDAEAARDTLNEELKKMQVSRTSLMAENKTIRNDFRVCEERMIELERYCDDLRETNERHKIDSASLTDEISKLRSATNVVDDKLPLLTEQLSDANRQLECKDKQFGELSVEYDKMKSALMANQRELEIKCDNLSAEIEEIQTERSSIVHLKDKVTSDYERQLQISAGECEELKKKLESFKLRLNDSEDNLTKMKRNWETDKSQLEEVRGRLKDSTEEFQDVKSQNKELMQKLKNHEVEILQIRNSCSNKDEEIKAIQKSLKTSSDEVNSLRLQLEMETKSRDDLQSKVEMSDAGNIVMEQLQLEKKGLQETINQLKAQLEEEIERSNVDLSMSRIEIQSQKEQILNLTTLLSEKDQRIKESEKVTSDVQIVCEKYQQKVNEEMSSRSCLEDRLMALSRELQTKEESLNKTIESQVAMKREHEIVLGNCQEERDNVKEDITKLTKQLESINMKASRVDILQKEIDQSNAKVNTLEDIVRTLTGDRDRLVNDNKTLKEIEDELKSKLHSIGEYKKTLENSIKEKEKTVLSQLDAMKSKDLVIIELQNQIAEMNANIGDLNEQLSCAVASATKLGNDLEKKSDECSRCVLSIETMRTELTENIGRQAVLQRQMSTFEESALQKDQSISQLTSENVHLDNVCKERERIIKELKEALDSSCLEKESTAGQLSMAKIQIEETQRLYSDAMRAQNSSENELRNVSEELLMVRQHLSELDEEYKKLQGEYSTEAEKLRREDIQLKNHVKALEKTLNESSETYKQEILESTERELTLKSHSEELEANMVKLTKSLQRTEEDLESEKCLRQTERNNMMEKISQLTDQLTGAEKLRVESEQKLDAIETDNIELKIRFEAEKEKLLDNIIILENNLKKQSEGFTKKCREFDQLQSAILDLGRENQSLQITKEKITSRLWIVDDEAVECHNCHKFFSLTNRKHHCRNCGQVFCQDCSTKTATLAVSRKPVRVCDVCHLEVSSHRRRGSTQSSNISLSIQN